jgi:hypothetical protein
MSYVLPKAGSVLRNEMVINSAEESRVRKRVTRNRRKSTQWVPMRKGVACLFRYQGVSRQANYRYLDALAVVDDPSPAIEQLDDINVRKETASGRGVRAVNQSSRNEALLFKVMMAGETCVRGLSNADIRARLEDSTHLRELANYTKRQSAKVSRILSRFHSHCLIAKIPRTRRWRVTDRGRRVMAASLPLREPAFPQHFTHAAAA